MTEKVVMVEKVTGMRMKIETVVNVEVSSLI